MKILILNGSPRKGNTFKALSVFQNSLDGKHVCENINLYDYSVSPCRNCDYCQTKKQCVHKDDTNLLLKKIIESDVLVVGTPVYYWGMSAQTKLVIDKFYSVNSELTDSHRKLIVICTGANPLSDIQYELIDKHFKAISDYLKWDYTTFMPVSAYATDDIDNEKEVLEKIKQTAKSL